MNRWTCPRSRLFLRPKEWREIAPEPRQLRWVRWDHDWLPQTEAGDAISLPARLAHATDWTRAFARAARAATGSEYFLTYLPEDPGEYAWGPPLTRWADVRAELDRPTDLYRATLTGAELEALAQTVEDSLEGAAFMPAVDRDVVRSSSMYRVCMPAWLVWDVAGRLHRNLPHVEWARTDELWLHFERQQRGN